MLTRWAPRDFKFGRTLSTACIIDDLVYITELHGFLHCLDAKTGKHYWQFDTKEAVWTAAYYVDGKILVATEGGILFVFRHDPRPEVIDEMDFAAIDQKEARLKQRSIRKRVEDRYLLFKIEFDAAIRGTPSVANGTLFVATENMLYAFKQTE